MFKKILYIIALICFVVSAVIFFNNKNEYNRRIDSISFDKKLQKKVNTDRSIRNKKQIENLNWDELKAQYKSIIAWIKIPNTSIDYPVLQGEDNKYYLYHNYNNQPDELGSIFLNHSQKSDFSSFNNIVYGHNILMKTDQPKFTELNNYLQQDFKDKHNVIYLFTPEKVYVGEIFAAHSDDSNGDANNININTKEELNSYVNKMKKESVIQSNVENNSIEKILTLWTCTMKSTTNSKGQTIPAEDARTFVNISLK